MTDTKPEPLGAVERAEVFLKRKDHKRGCKHIPDATFPCDTCAKNRLAGMIREAEDALRERAFPPMECDHPRACWIEVAGLGEGYCVACVAQAQAVKEAVEEEREKNCRAMCKHCRVGRPVKEAAIGDDLVFPVHYIWVHDAEECFANDIRRGERKLISEEERP